MNIEIPLWLPYLVIFRASLFKEKVCEKSWKIINNESKSQKIMWEIIKKPFLSICRYVNMSICVDFCQFMSISANYVMSWRHESILVNIRQNLSKNVRFLSNSCRYTSMYVDFRWFLSICHVDLCRVLSMCVEVADGGGLLKSQNTWKSRKKVLLCSSQALDGNINIMTSCLD